MERWTTLKKLSQWPLSTVKIEGNEVDGVIKSVILTDERGVKVRIQGAYGYGPEIAIVPPPKMRKVWRVSGEILGIMMKPHDYDEEHEAKIAVNDAVARLGDTNCLLTIDEVEVPEEE